jgi:hypothetical protein
MSKYRRKIILRHFSYYRLSRPSHVSRPSHATLYGKCKTIFLNWAPYKYYFFILPEAKKVSDRSEAECRSWLESPADRVI